MIFPERLNGKGDELCREVIISLGLDYFYGSEADKFIFYRLPKVLFTDARFSKLSAEAKILYGLMLDSDSIET